MTHCKINSVICTYRTKGGRSMHVSKKALVLIVIIAAVGGGIASRALSSSETLKQNITEKETSHNDVTTIIKERKRPDGSSESETTISEPATQVT